MKATSNIQRPQSSEAEKDTAINQKIDAITQKDPCLEQKKYNNDTTEICGQMSCVSDESKQSCVDR